MNPDAKRPIVVLLTGHWVSMLGVALATTAGFSWLFVLPQHLRGHVDNPYIGILFFLIIPAILILGLALIPVGVFLSRRRIASGLTELPDHKAAWRRLVVFLGVMTFVNVVIGSQATYRAVQHMETVQFCGQSCHVMKPEFTAWKHAPHSQLECVECHVGPGASGWLRSKMSGTRQLADVVFNSFPRPIPSAMESNRLIDSVDTCERCHARSLEAGSPVVVKAGFKDDEQNTRSESVLTVLVGGPRDGIHGAHMGPGIHVRYAASDAKRQTIPWVEYRDAKGGILAYTASGAKPGSIDPLTKYEMQCVDCHNRPAHSFQTADRALDSALASGDLPATLPFIKKTGLALLTASYASGETASNEIPAKLSGFYQAKYPDLYTKNHQEITGAGQALAAIYNSNVFPDLKVTWGTYPNNLGHTDAPGCFRCHDGDHSSPNKKTITNDCTVCHQLVAVDEQSPAVLKTLGIATTP
jgi:hypothetical protein